MAELGPMLVPKCGQVGPMSAKLDRLLDPTLAEIGLRRVTKRSDDVEQRFAWRSCAFSNTLHGAHMLGVCRVRQPTHAEAQ